jgi:tRNA(Ile)-lysidine synthase TilS/MesJ
MSTAFRDWKEMLTPTGIQTQILKIDWGSHSRPENLPNFESLARKYRFQDLGKACRDSNIDSLFLGHHQDDQAETVLMRLISGHQGFGLRGIKRAGEIPECQGIHGVHESGGHLERYLLPSPSLWKKPSMAIETGGVRIYRPLLNFGKNRLRATCEAADIKWFEDHTNKDPTVTLRNAIRHMYNSHAMPAALEAPSILKLSEAFESKYQKLSRIADSHFKTAKKKFEPRSGRMLIIFPGLKELEGSLSPRDTSLVAALFLLQAIQYVTPAENTNLASLDGPVSRIFPRNRDGNPYHVPTAFTISGVHLQPLSPPTAGQGADDVIWSLSRQLYMADESEKQHINIHRTEKHGWSPWSLFDGRFWIRVQNPYGKKITVRPLHKTDRERYMDQNRSEANRYPDAMLKSLAPGTVRWTLPVIIAKSKYGSEDVLAFPTLDWRLPGYNNVNWEIRYKKVDMENLE